MTNEITTYRVTIVDMEKARISDMEFVKQVVNVTYKDPEKKEFSTMQEAKEFASQLDSKGIANYINTVITFK